MNIKSTPLDYYYDAPGHSNHAIKTDIQNRIQNGVNTTSEILQTPYKSADVERDCVELALAYMNSLNLQFGDLRFGTDYNRALTTTDRNLINHTNNHSSGIGIRVLYNGFWGFCATQKLDEQGIKNGVDKAFFMAKEVAKNTPKELALKSEQWCGEPTTNSEFHTPILICPISTAPNVIIDPLITAADLAFKQNTNIKKVQGRIDIYAKRRWYGNTDGSRLLSTHAIVDAYQRFYAVTDQGSAYRTLVAPGTAGGLEHFFAANFADHAEKACHEAVEKSRAKTPISGSYDLILDGHNLALTMHESVGHPTELDRILGYEFGFAGGSFVKPEYVNEFRYGSDIVNFEANNKILFGPASQGFDDEGVAAQDFSIINDGILSGMGTCRETAHKIGLLRSNGCSRATHWYDPPIVRIPNLFLKPGKDSLSLESLIGDTKKGILLLGRDSFSIDQMRYNFQFGSDMAYRIENGKIAEPLVDVIYQSISPEFWQSCDAICDETEWQMHGIFNCGKGQPMQLGKMMHGASPSRFRNIKVGF